MPSSKPLQIPKLSHQQWEFTQLLAKSLPQWIKYCEDNNLKITIREVWRTPEQARKNVILGVGVANSLHIDSLAVDIIIRRLSGHPIWNDRDGHYFELAEIWFNNHPQAKWGGLFTKKDYGHFSLSYYKKRG